MFKPAVIQPWCSHYTAAVQPWCTHTVLSAVLAVTPPLGRWQRRRCWMGCSAMLGTAWRRRSGRGTWGGWRAWTWRGLPRSRSCSRRSEGTAPKYCIDGTLADSCGWLDACPVLRRLAPAQPCPALSWGTSACAPSPGDLRPSDRRGVAVALVGAGTKR